jgi:hypothetical protein
MPASVPSVPSIKGKAARGIRALLASIGGGPIQYNGVGMIYNDNAITYNYI